jgi:hypothetical protein
MKEASLKDQTQSKGFVDCCLGIGVCSNYSIVEVLNIYHWHIAKRNLIISVNCHFFNVKS